MSRTHRLFELMQLLREKRTPISAKTLADKLEISQRTLYRDIETLRGQGANIQGEAGIGFILKDSFTLPPLMFTSEEIEALVLGSRWVKAYGDEALQTSAIKALTKIRAVSSKSIQQDIDTHTLFVPSYDDCKEGDPKFAQEIRIAIRDQQKTQIFYKDEKGAESDRIIYPFALAFFGMHQVIIAWCELRQDFRHFRVDRISALEQLNQVYSPNKQTLLKRWRESEAICDDFDSPQ